MDVDSRFDALVDNAHYLYFVVDGYSQHELTKRELVKEFLHIGWQAFCFVGFVLCHNHKEEDDTCKI